MTIRMTPLTLTPREIELVQALVDGHTVADAANERGLSERQVRRILGRAWRKLGANGRNQGLARAGSLGLVDA